MLHLRTLQMSQIGRGLSEQEILTIRICMIGPLMMNMYLLPNAKDQNWDLKGKRKEKEKRKKDAKENL